MSANSSSHYSENLFIEFLFTISSAGELLLLFQSSSAASIIAACYQHLPVHEKYWLHKRSPLPTDKAKNNYGGGS